MRSSFIALTFLCIGCAQKFEKSEFSAKTTRDSQCTSAPDNDIDLSGEYNITDLSDKLLSSWPQSCDEKAALQSQIEILDKQYSINCEANICQIRRK